MKPEPTTVATDIGRVALTYNSKYSAIFKILDEDGDCYCGFNILNNSKFVKIKKDKLLIINDNEAIISIITNPDVRLFLSLNVFKNASEAAKEMGISSRTIYRHIKDSTIRHK